MGLRVAALRAHRLQNIPQLLIHREPPLRLSLKPAFQGQPLGADGNGLLEQNEAIVDMLPLKRVGPLGRSLTIASEGRHPVKNNTCTSDA